MAFEVRACQQSLSLSSKSDLHPAILSVISQQSMARKRTGGPCGTLAQVDADLSANGLGNEDLMAAGRANKRQEESMVDDLIYNV